MKELNLAPMLRAFRHRNYRLFFGGQFISLCGTWMQTIAQSWLVYRLTGSAIMLGVVGFSSQIPVFLFSPIGGAVADRYDRRRIIIATQIASMLLAFILAILTLTNKIQVWHIPVIAALLGTVNAFDIPTRQSFIIEMVGKDDLVNAIALNSSMFNSARIIGPAIAGVLVAAVGEGWCFFVNAASYTAVIAGFLLMRIEKQVQGQPHEPPLRSIINGFKYAWHTKAIRALLLLVALISIMGMSYTVLMPIFADKILHGGPQTLGLLMCTAGVGALIGALTLAARGKAHGLDRWIAFSSSGFGITLILFSFSHSLWLSVALLLPLGFFMINQMASANTLLQTITPDNLRGRVMAVYSMMFIGMAPFGALLAGALAQQFGAPKTVLIGGITSLAGALIFLSRLNRKDVIPEGVFR